MLPRKAGRRECACNLSVSSVINIVKIWRKPYPTYHTFSLIELSLIGACAVQEHTDPSRPFGSCQIGVSISVIRAIMLSQQFLAARKA